VIDNRDNSQVVSNYILMYKYSIANNNNNNKNNNKDKNILPTLHGRFEVARQIKSFKSRYNLH
jgi:hypothetical protein